MSRLVATSDELMWQQNGLENLAGNLIDSCIYCVRAECLCILWILYRFDENLP